MLMPPKVFTYVQSSGAIRNEEGAFVGAGWAGNGTGKNNPDAEDQHDIGPLPCGLYSVGAWEEDHPHLGPIVAHLEQIEGETFGRSGFYIHGPAVESTRYGQESKGCIVVPRTTRLVIKSLSPDQIRVVAQ
jgi:hypothetical protein